MAMKSIDEFISWLFSSIDDISRNDVRRELEQMMSGSRKMPSTKNSGDESKPIHVRAFKRLGKHVAAHSRARRAKK